MKLTGEKSQCAACGRVFSTTSNFDKHRKGRHGIDRHCVDPATVGLLLSDSGLWRGQPRPKDL
jgi:hypothetical protein